MTARSRVLVIKTSSLGDVVHALPAITDIARTGRWSIDWVCEEAFVDIPAMHRAVDNVIPCAIRRWRRNWTTTAVRSELRAFKSRLSGTAYDAVLDLQGLVKSAALARMAQGPRHGYAWRNAREPLASLAYSARHSIDWGQHAITRNRLLAAAALGSDASAEPRYGVEMASGPTSDEPFVVALHATSREDKLWPEAHWRQLLSQLMRDGIRTALPWGTDAERARSLRLALDISGVSVPARMSPRELASLFARAHAVVGVDTGLVHLAAAVGTPTLALFVATDPRLTGVIGERAPAINLGGDGTMPDVGAVLDAMQQLLPALALEARR